MSSFNLTSVHLIIVRVNWNVCTLFKDCVETEFIKMTFHSLKLCFRFILPVARSNMEGLSNLAAQIYKTL